MERRIIFRFIELVICVSLLILWYVLGSYGYKPMLVCGSVLAYLIITLVLVALEFMDFDSTMVYLIIGAVLFILAGVLLIVDNSEINSVIAALLFLANGVIFLVDFIFEIKDNSED